MRRKDDVIRASVLLTLLLVIFSFPIGAANNGSIDVAHVMDITGSVSARLSLPTDVAVSHDRICVVDGGNHRVAVFNIEGTFLFNIGSQGSAQGQFLRPVGLGTDEDGRIYVADTGNHRIQIFNLYGKFLAEFPVISNQRLIRPIDVAVNQDLGFVYVTGNNNHKLMVFGVNGRLIREWGGNGAEKGEFRYPATLVVMPDNRISVVDVLNTRVQVFRDNGEFSIQVGEWGVLPGQLFRPKGIATDGQGRFYVSDSYMNVVQVYSDIGQFLYYLKVSDSTYRMRTPTGMTIAGDRLYIAELLANKVSVFKLDD
jgi:DNA-binding beta-propeller fold protein YncE